MKLLWLAIGLITLVYPFWVYWGLQRFEAKYLALAAVFIYLLRILTVAKTRQTRIMALLGAAALAFVAWAFNSPTLLKLVPAFISVSLLVFFSYSLFRPPTFPARMALKEEGFLNDYLIQYTDLVTKAWIGFFAFNACVSLYTAFYSSQEMWALYNGLISYFLIAAIFSVEYSYRLLVVKKRLKRDGV